MLIILSFITLMIIMYVILICIKRRKYNEEIKHLEYENERRIEMHRRKLKNLSTDMNDVSMMNAMERYSQRILRNLNKIRSGKLHLRCKYNPSFNFPINYPWSKNFEHIPGAPYYCYYSNNGGYYLFFHDSIWHDKRDGKSIKILAPKEIKVARLRVYDLDDYYRNNSYKNLGKTYLYCIVKMDDEFIEFDTRNFSNENFPQFNDYSNNAPIINNASAIADLFRLLGEDISA